jgi:hypothetical protein
VEKCRRHADEAVSSHHKESWLRLAADSNLPKLQKNGGVGFLTNGPAAKSAGPFARLAKRTPEALGLGRPQFSDQTALDDDLCHWPSRQL